MPRCSNLQADRIRNLMLDGTWRSAVQISQITGDIPGSITSVLWRLHHSDALHLTTRKRAKGCPTEYRATLPPPPPLPLPSTALEQGNRRLKERIARLEGLLKETSTKTEQVFRRQLLKYGNHLLACSRVPCSCGWSRVQQDAKEAAWLNPNPPLKKPSHSDHTKGAQ